MNRRDFLQKTAVVSAAALSLSFANQEQPEPAVQPQPAEALPPPVPFPQDRPNVILVRFGGGVRRRETIEFPERTYCPFIYHELYQRHGGVLFSNVELEGMDGVVTSHAQGTLYLLTGKYDRYNDVAAGYRFEPAAPTLFEYFRRKYDVPSQQALIVNSEDRIDEEFYTFSNSHIYGVRYRSQVLSLYRFKTFLLHKQIAAGEFVGRELEEKQRELTRMENLDTRIDNRDRAALPEMDAFWEKWQAHYGRSGFVNPRGDRLLTTLSL